MRYTASLLIVLSAMPFLALADDASQRWEKDIAAFEAQDKAHPPQPGGVLFLGSSSIRMWDLAEWFPDQPVLNRGFGGSQIADSIHCFERVVVPYAPSAVVFYAGDNDIAAGSQRGRRLERSGWSQGAIRLTESECKQETN